MDICGTLHESANVAPYLKFFPTTKQLRFNWFLQVSGSDEVFAAGMQAVVQLSAVVGPALIPHLKILLSSVNFAAALYFSIHRTFAPHPEISAYVYRIFTTCPNLWLEWINRPVIQKSKVCLFVCFEVKYSFICIIYGLVRSVCIYSANLINSGQMVVLYF